MSGTSPARRPDVVVVLVDDMGFSDIGCYGGEIPTPNLDRLAAGGVRMSQFYNTARCSPSRASLLTGLHPHQTGIGILTADDRPEGYAGTLGDRCVTVAEVLRAGGYSTYMSGKWHLTGSMHQPTDAWPTRRGFDRFYGTVAGGGNYWNPVTLTRDETRIEHEALDPEFFYTDAITDAATGFVADHARERGDQPFFLYVAYTAPHWPLHAPEDDVREHAGRFDEGWDVLRERRARRLVEQGILDDAWPLSDRDPEVRAWSQTSHQDWECRRMEVYAAQIARMDRGVGRIVDALTAAGRLDDTLLLFLSDNGGCAEELPTGWADEQKPRPLNVRTRTRDGRRVFRGNTPEVSPGGEETFASYGQAWANLSNTPFREYKHWVHEGGIATPLVVHWPAGGLEAGGVRHAPHQLPDVMATVLEVTGADYAAAASERDAPPPEGVSMVPSWHGRPVAERTLYWEHEGNAAVRRGRWKLVRKYPGDWELYDLTVDRTELHDRAAEFPDTVAELAADYQAWADRCGVIPRERILALDRYARLRPATR